MAVICRCTTEFLEAGARLAQRIQIALPRRGVFAGLLAEPGNVGGEACEFRIYNGIGTEGRNDARLPAGISNDLDGIERVGGRVGRREHFDIEPLEERT